MDRITESMAEYTAAEFIALFHHWLEVQHGISKKDGINGMCGIMHRISRPREFTDLNVQSGWVYLTEARPDIDLDYAVPTREVGRPIARIVLDTGVYLLDETHQRVYHYHEPVGRLGGQVYQGDMPFMVLTSDFLTQINLHHTPPGSFIP